MSPKGSRPPRRRRQARPRPELLVFVEGIKTEDGYLLPLRRDLRGEVTITVDLRGGAPLTLVRRAVEAKRSAEREERRGRGRSFDAVWCLFDRDDHPNITEALALAAAHGIEVAMSNPCIELWFIVHFEDQTAAIDRHAAQQRSAQLLSCGKSLTAAATARLYTRYEDAKRRAKELDGKHEGDGSPARSNPSSDVWCLVENARRLAGR